MDNDTCLSESDYHPLRFSYGTFPLAYRMKLGERKEIQCVHDNFNWMQIRSDTHAKLDLAGMVSKSETKIWSLVRKFDEPQKCKIFVRRCVMREGGMEVGSIREIEVISGLPATTSIEQLERLDENEDILGMCKLDGDDRLKNCLSIITLHHDGIHGKPGTTAVESFVVDVPDGNTVEDNLHLC